MNRFAILLAAGAATCATPAFADDAGDVDNGGIFVGAVAGFDNVTLEAGGVDDAENGLVYGVTAGYDIDTGKTIIGVEVELTDTTIGDDFGGAGLDIYGGLRLGYEADDNDTFYLKAGYSNVDADLVSNLEGVRLGFGVEHDFGGFVGRVEYRYSNYNFSDVLNAEVNGNRHQVAVTLGTKL